MATTDVEDVLARARRDPELRRQLLKELVATPPPAATWRRAFVPSSFKEGGALVLTAVLAIVFAAMLVVTLSRLGSDPHGVEIGGTTREVDEFGRAKDLLGVVVPLFAAAVTFWLGVAVEGRRADQNEDAAHSEAAQREIAQAEAHRIGNRASEALAEASGALTPATSAGGAEGGEQRAGRGAGGPDLAQVRAILDRARREIAP
jgi:hypothetical protein